MTTSEGLFVTKLQVTLLQAEDEAPTFRWGFSSFPLITPQRIWLRPCHIGLWLSVVISLSLSLAVSLTCWKVRRQFQCTTVNHSQTKSYDIYSSLVRIQQLTEMLGLCTNLAKYEEGSKNAIRWFNGSMVLNEPRHPSFWEKINTTTPCSWTCKFVFL